MIMISKPTVPLQLASGGQNPFREKGFAFPKALGSVIFIMPGVGLGHIFLIYRYPLRL